VSRKGGIAFHSCDFLVYSWHHICEVTMKKLTFTIACLAVLASLAHSEVNWKRDLSSALKQAKASKQLIFVDFYADW